MGQGTRERTPTRQTPCLEMELEHKSLLGCAGCGGVGRDQRRNICELSRASEMKILRIEIVIYSAASSSSFGGASVAASGALVEKTLE